MAQSNSVTRRRAYQGEALRRARARDFKLPPSASWKEIAQNAIHEDEEIDWDEENEKANDQYDFESQEDYENWLRYANGEVDPETLFSHCYDEPYPDDYDFEIVFRNRDEFGPIDSDELDDWWHERHPVEPIMGSHNL